MSGQLEQLGWTEYLSRLSPETTPGSLGRVRRVDRGEVDVLTDAGEVRARSDSQRAQSVLAPATGDWVRLATEPDGAVLIDEILPRYSAIVRRDPAEDVVEQVLAANVDVVGVTAAVDRRANIARIERFLVLAADSGAQPVVILTKVDLTLNDEWERMLTELVDVRLVRTSAKAGLGIAEVRELIRPHRSLVLLGESGAGKSTLVNALVGDAVQATKEVRAGDAKGRHTTTARELIVIPGGGVLIDTPGVRGVGLWDAGPAVSRVFADIVDLGFNCRFGDCSHRVEPDCAVRSAVQNKELGQARLDRYLRLVDELADQADQFEERRRKSGRGRR